MTAFRVAVLCVALLPALAVDAQEAHPCAKLETAIPHGIKLLEEKKFKEFIETFAHPDELKKILENTDLETIAKGLAESDKGAILIKIFKDLQGKEPMLAENGSKATYKVTTEGSPKDAIEFVKVEGRWYIRN